MLKKLKWLSVLVIAILSIGSTSSTTQVFARSTSSAHTTTHVSAGRSTTSRSTVTTRATSPRSAATRSVTATRSVASRSAATRAAANRTVSSRSAVNRTTSANVGRSTANRSAVNRTMIKQQKEIRTFTPAQHKSHDGYLKMYNGFKSDAKHGVYSPSDYLYNPYRYRFYNYYYYDSILTRDAHVAKLSGIDLKKVSHPKKETYWVSVKDKKGKIAKVLVNKQQWEKIKLNDNVRLIADKFLLNNHQI